MITEPQHPQVGDTWQAHCCACGTYIDDWAHEPPIDLLCDDCQDA